MAEYIEDRIRKVADKPTSVALMCDVVEAARDIHDDCGGCGTDLCRALSALDAHAMEGEGL